MLLFENMFAKKMQTSAMKARFQIAECSFSSAKVIRFQKICKTFVHFLASLMLFYYPDDDVKQHGLPSTDNNFN